MDLFVLDSQLRRTEVFDRYESLIWTERFAAYGDFELQIPASLESRNAFGQGTRLAINDSTRVMVVESVVDKKDTEGRLILDVRGNSLEKILTDRTARNVATLPNAVDWVFTGLTPGAIARKIFNDICVTGALSANDIIPFYTAGNIYPTDTITEPTAVGSLSLPIQSVYSAIKQVCDIYDLGFRLVRNGDTSQLMFNVYSGNDRTTIQTTLPSVIFSPELDNLSDVSYLTSSSGFKNVAYVVAPNGSRYVYGNGADSSISGFDRKVLYVDASDITDAAGSTLQAKLEQRGIEQLALNTNFAAFDGQIPPNSQYKYHVDYELGDLITIRNSDNVANQMRVTEQIFVSDAEGIRSYPTLSVKLLINPGSWYALPPTEVWYDYTTEVWNDL